MSTKSPFTGGVTELLPIDEHRDEILRRISRDRVTIIHGETGCGKSSRLPAFILEDAAQRNQSCKIMVSQPRRIAASSLMKRLRTTLGDRVGLRMGHGIRDDNDNTCIHFVTTGYLVRLIGYFPGALSQHTHLIIDEVHERSVDGDLLCLLARRLLTELPRLRLILMSATVQMSLYKNYFSRDGFYYGSMDCLSVGVKRFPLDTYYLDDLIESRGIFPSAVSEIARRLKEITHSCGTNSKDDVPLSVSREQYGLCFNLVRAICRPGTGILIFVSGIADITELTERFEGMSRYKLYAIHSDLPFEDQEAAFIPAGPNEMKIVIATNAAESSITLPDVDCVICLGTHKAMRYHPGSHRVQLVNTWISKASAIQRAGRTGRVRPGVVYRLYSEEIYERFMQHEQCEVHRRPLQDVILSLRAMLEDSERFNGVVPILEELIEPPTMDNVERSFAYLHGASMLTTPDDSGELTSFGRLAGTLPVDLQLSRLIGYGAAMGLSEEVIVVAAALSQPKTLFRIASPLIHTDPREYNAIVRQTFLSSIELDDGVYSEPLMYLKMFIQWQRMSDSYGERDSWMQRYGIVRSRMRQFVGMAEHLQERVNESFGFATARNSRSGAAHAQQQQHQHQRNLSNDPSQYIDPIDIRKLVHEPSPGKLNALRLLLTWTSEGNVLRQRLKDVKSAAEFTTVRLFPELNTQQRAALVPRCIESKEEIYGRWQFEAVLSAKRRLGRFEDTMKQLALSAVDVQGRERASAVWIVQEPQEFVPGAGNEGRGMSWSYKNNAGNRGGYSSSGGRADDDDDDPNDPYDRDGFLIIIAFDPTCFTHDRDLVLSFFNQRRLCPAEGFSIEVPKSPSDWRLDSKMNTRNDVACASRVGSQGRDGGQSSTAAGTTTGTGALITAAASTHTIHMETYVIRSPSERELWMLRNLHDILPVSVSLEIPSQSYAPSSQFTLDGTLIDRRARIIASNCSPNTEQLRRVFFADGDIPPLSQSALRTYSCIREYRGTISQERRLASLEELLTKLLLAGVSTDKRPSGGGLRTYTAASWLVQERQSTAVPTPVLSSSSKSYLVVLAIDSGCDYRVRNCILDTFEPRKRKSAGAVTIRAPLNRNGNSNNSGSMAGTGAAVAVLTFDTFIVDNPNDHEILCLKDLHSILNVSTSLEIPLDVEQPAIVLAGNCQPTVEQLRGIFIGDGDGTSNNSNNRSHESNRHDACAKLTKAIVRPKNANSAKPTYTFYTDSDEAAAQQQPQSVNLRYISMDMLVTKQRLIFPRTRQNLPINAAGDTPQRNFNNDSFHQQHRGIRDGSSRGHIGAYSERDAMTAASMYTGAVVANSSSSGSSSMPLIDDISLGIRLLHAYCSGYKDGKLRLRPENNSTGSNGQSNKWNHPSSGQNQSNGAVQRGGGGGGGFVGGGGGSGFDDGRLIISVKTAAFGWDNLSHLSKYAMEGRSGSEADPPPAALPRQSVPSVALHSGRGALYGVTHHAMLIGAGAGASTVGCEGVTLLPPGSRWLSLALSCIGIDVTSLHSEMTASSREENNALNTSANRNPDQRPWDESDRDVHSSGKGRIPDNSSEEWIPVYDYPLSKEDFKACSVIRRLLDIVPRQPIRRNETLIGCVRRLFIEWENIANACIPSAEADAELEVQVTALLASVASTMKLPPASGSSNSRLSSLVPSSSSSSSAVVDLSQDDEDGQKGGKRSSVAVGAWSSVDESDFAVALGANSSVNDEYAQRAAQLRDMAKQEADSDDDGDSHFSTTSSKLAWGNNNQAQGGGGWTSDWGSTSLSETQKSSRNLLAQRFQERKDQVVVREALGGANNKNKNNRRNGRNPRLPEKPKGIDNTWKDRQISKDPLDEGKGANGRIYGSSAGVDTTSAHTTVANPNRTAAATGAANMSNAFDSSCMAYGAGNFRNKDDESDDDDDDGDGDNGRRRRGSSRRGSSSGKGGGKRTWNTGPPLHTTNMHTNNNSNVLGGGKALRNHSSSAPAAQQPPHGTIQQRRAAYFSSAFPCEGRGESKQDVPGTGTGASSGGGIVGFKRKASTAGVAPNGMSVAGWSETVLGALTKAPQQRTNNSNGT